MATFEVFDELMEITGSTELHKRMRFWFVQEIAKEEGTLVYGFDLGGKMTIVSSQRSTHESKRPTTSSQLPFPKWRFSPNGGTCDIAHLLPDSIDADEETLTMEAQYEQFLLAAEMDRINAYAQPAIKQMPANGLELEVKPMRVRSPKSPVETARSGPDETDVNRFKKNTRVKQGLQEWRISMREESDPTFEGCFELLVEALLPLV
ncbi:hypothetical protein Tco_0080635 [Tanacetum coccineum]